MDTKVNWPERPTCHDSDYGAQQFGSTHWCEPRGDDGGPYQEDYRRCSYCGSMHPEDFVAALRAGATLEAADFKYGWPHKLYIDIANPKVGQECRMGSSNGEPIMGKAPAKAMSKFYNSHLLDLSPEAFAVVAQMIAEKVGIRFELRSDKLHYGPAKGS